MKRQSLLLLLFAAMLLLSCLLPYGPEEPRQTVSPPPSDPVAEPAETPAPRPVSEHKTPEETEGEMRELFHVLLIGVDNDNASTMDERGNADGLLLVTLNPETEELLFTSFLRDTSVRVNDSYYDKLTSVYHTGGPELLCKTLGENFGVEPDYYVQFNYLDVIELVDSVGGVELTLTENEIYFMDSKIRNLCGVTGQNFADNTLTPDQAGELLLNGLQTAAYMRIRPAEGNYDFGRTERIRNVVLALLRKFKSADVSELLRFSRSAYRRLTSNIPASFFLKLAGSISSIKDYTLVMDRIPIDGSFESGNTGSGYFITPDYESNRQHLHDSLFEGIHGEQY